MSVCNVVLFVSAQSASSFCESFKESIRRKRESLHELVCEQCELSSARIEPISLARFSPKSRSTALTLLSLSLLLTPLPTALQPRRMGIPNYRQHMIQLLSAAPWCVSLLLPPSLLRSPLVTPQSTVADPSTHAAASTSPAPRSRPSPLETRPVARHKDRPRLIHLRRPTPASRHPPPPTFDHLEPV